MYCQHCGKEVSKGDRYCPWCDAPLDGGGSDAARNPSRKSSARQAAPADKRGITISLPAALALGVVVVGALLFSVLRHSPSPGAAAPAAVENQWSPQVVAVAKKFICPCGTCTDNLVMCDCTNRGGAFEAKTFIGQELAAGKTPERVVTAMTRKYKLKPIE